MPGSHCHGAVYSSQYVSQRHAEPPRALPVMVGVVFIAILNAVKEVSQPVLTHVERLQQATPLDASLNTLKATIGMCSIRLGLPLWQVMGPHAVRSYTLSAFRSVEPQGMAPKPG